MQIRTLSLVSLATLGLTVYSCVPPCNDACCEYYAEEAVCDTQYVHRYGIPIPKHHWEESGQNGQVIKTLRGGVVCAQKFYFGKLDGLTSYTFPDSDVIEKTDLYSQDQLLKETWFYYSGQGRKEIVYNPPQHTIINEWYENGTLKSSEKWAGSLLAHGEYFDAQQERISSIDDGSGTRSNNDSFGNLTAMDYFSNGELDHRIIYYPNSSPKEVTPYKNGLVDGLRKTYYPGGEPMTIETWQRGKQEGITTLFKNAEKSEDVPYVDGVKNGRGYIYKDGALIAQEVTWKDDQLNGPAITYFEGNPVTEWYYKGRKVNKGYFDSFNKTPESMIIDFKQSPETSFTEF